MEFQYRQSQSPSSVKKSVLLGVAVSFVIILGDVTHGQQTPASPCGDPVATIMSLQACVPRYLVNLWQSRTLLPLSSGLSTKDIFPYLCNKINDYKRCADDLLNTCSSYNETTKQEVISSVSPVFPPIDGLCKDLPDDDSFSCPTRSIERCLTLLPPTKAEAAKMDSKTLCPLVRITQECLNKKTECDKSDKPSFDTAISSLSNGEEPFFYCESGWNYTGRDDIRTGVIDQNYSNESFKQNVSFHCKTHSRSCGLTRIYYIKEEGRNGLNHQMSSCCTGSNQGADCKPGSFYNLREQTCSPCPVGWYQEGYSSLQCVRCQGETTTATDGARDKLLCRDNGDFNGSSSCHTSIHVMALTLCVFKYLQLGLLAQ